MLVYKNSNNYWCQFIAPRETDHLPVFNLVQTKYGTLGPYEFVGIFRDEKERLRKLVSSIEPPELVLLEWDYQTDLFESPVIKQLAFLDWLTLFYMDVDFYIFDICSRRWGEWPPSEPASPRRSGPNNVLGGGCMRSEVTSSPPTRSTPTASELRRMPKDERDAIMEEAARVAEEIYRNDPSLTDFEAFEADDPHGDGETTSEG